MLDGGLFAIAGLGAGITFAIFILWSFVWKGFALWIASREGKKWWFVVILVLNTAGILEIIYIFAFSKWSKDYFARRREEKKKEKEDASKEEKKCCEDCGHEEGKCECDCHKED